MGHVTYVSGFYAHPTISYSILKIEWPSTSFCVPENPAVDPADPFSGLVKIKDEAIPWAARREEIQSKALLFRRDASSKFDGVGAFYLYNDLQGMTCWSPFAGGVPSYENRVIVGSLYGARVRLLEGSLAVTSDGSVRGSF